MIRFNEFLIEAWGNLSKFPPEMNKTIYRGNGRRFNDKSKVEKITFMELRKHIDNKDRESVILVIKDGKRTIAYKYDAYDTYFYEMWDSNGMGGGRPYKDSNFVLTQASQADELYLIHKSDENIILHDKRRELSNQRVNAAFTDNHTMNPDYVEMLARDLYDRAKKLNGSDVQQFISSDQDGWLVIKGKEVPIAYVMGKYETKESANLLYSVFKFADRKYTRQLVKALLDHYKLVRESAK